MKEPDDTMPFHPKRSGGVKRPIKSAPSSGGLKLARQGPLARHTPSLPEPENRAPGPPEGNLADMFFAACSCSNSCGQSTKSCTFFGMCRVDR